MYESVCVLKENKWYVDIKIKSNILPHYISVVLYVYALEI